MVRRAWLIIVLVLLIGCLLQGCLYQADLNNVNNRQTIAFITKNRGGDYWETVKIGAETAAREFGVNIHFSAPDNQEDIQRQIQLVNYALEDGVDALVLAPGDDQLLVEVTEKAYAMKIPVIIIDSQVNTDKFHCFIATDNVELGEKVGNELVKIAGPNCHAALLSFRKGAGNALQREEGFHNVVSKHRGIIIDVKEYCLLDTNYAQRLTRKILIDNPRINAVVAFNTELSVGAARGIKNMGKAGEVKLVALDNAPEAIEFLEDGVIQSMIVQNPFSMGYLGVKYAVDAMEGKKTPRYVDTGSKAINKNNMYFMENQKLLFPFVK